MRKQSTVSHVQHHTTQNIRNFFATRFPKLGIGNVCEGFLMHGRHNCLGGGRDCLGGKYFCARGICFGGFIHGNLILLATRRFLYLQSDTVLNSIKIDRSLMLYRTLKDVFVLITFLQGFLVLFDKLGNLATRIFNKARLYKWACLKRESLSAYHTSWFTYCLGFRLQ